MEKENKALNYQGKQPDVSDRDSKTGNLNGLQCRLHKTDVICISTR